MVARKMGKRFLLALGFVVLLPALAGAADFGAAEESLWGRLSDPAGFFVRVWDGLMSVWTDAASIDPNGKPNGAAACVGSDCGASIDPNG